jgi:hypothetical protein
MKLPSTNNENKLTWKCKIFGCKDEMLPAVYYDSGERHGIKGKDRAKGATASKTTTAIVFSGCIWCLNYKKILGEEELIWPKWYCDCEICENSKL